MILTNSCSDTVDPPEETDITLTLNPFDTENDSTLAEAAHYVAESSDMIGVGTDEVTRPKGTEETIRSENDGYETTETPVTFDRNDTVDIPMTLVDTTDPVDADSVEVTVWADDADTGEELDDLTFRIDGEIISAGVNRMILTEPQDTTIDLTIEQDGYESLTESILFDEDKEITVELTSTVSGKVTVTYSVRNDADESVDAAELTIADTLVATGADGTFEIPQSSETVTVCGAADWHEDNCVDVTPDADKPITITLPRETVSVSVTPDIVGYTDLYANHTGFSISPLITNNTMYYLSVGDSTRSGAGRAIDTGTEIAEGVTTTIEYPAGPEPIAIELRAEYFPEEGHDYSDEDYLNVAEGETQVPGDADSDIQLELAHVPACRDGVDNDFTGVADENAPGCIDYDASTSHEVGTDGWVYDPDDDVELLQIASITELYGGNDVIFVSSASDHREARIGGWDGFPESLPFALGQIDLHLANKIHASKDGQAFAVRFVCGDTRDTRTDTTGTTNIVPDEPGVDGWRTSLVEGVDAGFFNYGLSCSRYALHAREVNGDSPGDGDDEVIFAVPDTSGSATMVWIFEPEMATQTTSHPMAGFNKATGEDRHVQDVRTRNPREALRALDPRREQ